MRIQESGYLLPQAATAAASGNAIRNDSRRSIGDRIALIYQFGRIGVEVRIWQLAKTQVRPEIGNARKVSDALLFKARFLPDLIALIYQFGRIGVEVRIWQLAKTQVRPEIGNARKVSDALLFKARFLPD